MPRATKSAPVSNASLMKMLTKYESEISSILGMLVVAALAVFIFLFIKKFMPKPSISPVAETIESEDLMKKNSTEGTYTVKSGQGLSQIAKEVYQDGKMWKKIADANNLKPPYILRQGQVLVLPVVSPTEVTPETAKAPVASVAPVANEVVSPAATPVTTVVNPATIETKTPESGTYTVVKGDCLWKIAEAQYGTGYAWVKIYNANKEIIGKNPGLIFAGTELVLPE